MGGKKKELASTAKGQQKQTSTEYSGQMGQASEGAANIAPHIAQGAEQLKGEYTNLLGSGGGLSYSPISAGNISTGNLTETREKWGDFAKTGGFTPEREAAIAGDLSKLRELSGMDTVTAENIERMRGSGGFEKLLGGGISDADAARMRGGGVYDEFALTGGYSPEARANIKAQALAPISSMARGTRDEWARRQALSGGYSPGMDAASRALGRDTARGISDAALNANVRVQDLVNQGRLAGAQGLAASEGALQGLKSQNIMGAAQGIAAGESNVVQAKAADAIRKATGYQSAAQTEMQMQDLKSKYMAMGLSGEEATGRAIADIEAQNVQNQLQASMFNTSNQMAVDQYNIEDKQAQQAAGLAGLHGMYNTNIGMYENERDRANALLGGKTQANLGYLQQQQQIEQMPGTFDKIMQGIGGAAGLAGAFINPAQTIIHRGGGAGGDSGGVWV